MGRLLEGPAAPSYPNFLEELRTCASRLLAFSENAHLAFVGRSPESLFDYLSGVLQDTPKADDLVLVNISNRYRSIADIKGENPSTVEALKEHFRECGLSPEQIISRKEKTLFTDLVASGGTFGQIAAFLLSWAEEEHLCAKDLRRKLGFLGITWRTKTSPNTHRWQQESDWVDRLQIRNIRNISIPGSLWDHLGNTQEKASQANPPTSWGTDSILQPPREESNLLALRTAYDLYHRGLHERDTFTRLLAEEKAMKEPWFRRLVTELREFSTN